MNRNAKIYLMRDASGALKLGHSVNPERRAKDIGRPVQIVLTTDVIDQVERIERLAHRVLALHGRHIRGEWFEATIDQALSAIEIAIRQAAETELPLGGVLERRTFVRKRYNQNFNFKVDQTFFDALDKLRRRETPEMSRSDMVRKLVLEAAKKAR